MTNRRMIFGTRSARGSVAKTANQSDQSQETMVTLKFKGIYSKNHVLLSCDLHLFVIQGDYSIKGEIVPGLAAVHNPLI